ncbi:MAG: hypothetical protein LBV69_11665 [Bacteroidales bacterium]|jgi:hypothetical protein|nr:hypothetical protein [Bacteroidales bacterium]
MYKRVIVLFFAILLGLNNVVFSQSKEWVEYLELRDSATILYRAYKYDEAKIFYGKMLSIKKKFSHELDLYWYVCCLTYARDTVEVEPYLLELVQSNWFEYKYIKYLYDELHTQDYWYNIDSIAKINDNNKNYIMIDSLAKMAKRDREVRTGTISANSMFYVDSINLAKLKELIALYGFPTWKLVGWEGVIYAWLIAQHAPLEFQEWFLEYYKQAVEENNAEIKYNAYLTDRIRLKNGIPQLYGTQGINYQLRAIDNIDNLNDRRESVFMPPLDISKIVITDTFPIINESR